MHHEIISSIVDRVNDQYGTEEYLPAEYLWQDNEYSIKVFGSVAWSTISCTATSHSTIECLVYDYINKYVLRKVWEEQVKFLRDEILWKLKDENVKEDLYLSFEKYFDNELKMIKGETN